MSHYLMLLKLRDISARSSVISKAKKYLKPGQKPPAGVQIHTGPRKGMYYNTEDLKAVKESKKKEAPKKEEESGEKKKRLPAFRKQEDGSVMHRTKEGEHGPGAYRIESKDGEHHLTFEGKDGDVKFLGKHTDIKELKRMVAGFKGGEKKEKTSTTPEKKSTIQAWKEVTHPEEYPEHQPERKTKLRIKVPEEKPVSQVKDQKATVRRQKETKTQQPGLTAKLGIRYTIGWSGNEFQRVEVTDPDTNETLVYDIKIREGIRRGSRGKQLFNKTEAKAEAIRLATERKEKGSDAIIQGVSDKMNEQKTKPSSPAAQQAIDKHIASNKEKNIDRLVFARSGDSYLTSTGETVPASKLEQNVNRLSIEHGKYVDVLEQVNKQGDLGHVRTISTPGTEDKPFSSGDKQASSGERKKERLKNFSQLEAHIYAKRLEADGYRNVKLEKQIRGGNPDSGNSTDYWYELSYDLPEKEETKQKEIAKQYPELAGDKRHDPDQKKIATGLGQTEKKKAKESVAEFGVDTRQKIKEIAEKKTRQDRLSQNRLDTKNW